MAWSTHRVSRLLTERDTISVPVTLDHTAITSRPPATGPAEASRGAMAQIVLDQVDKVYPGGVKGIDGLNLSITDGEFMVLVGPSG